jgi:hypothetical protein
MPTLTMNRKLSNDRARSILSGGNEPEFTAIPQNADMDILLEKAVYWYRQNFTSSAAKKWIAEWLTDEGREEDAKAVSYASKNSLKMISAYCRCASRGFPMTEKQKEFICKNVNELLNEARRRVPTEPKERITVQDRIEAKANEMLTTLEPVLDFASESVVGTKKKPNPIMDWIRGADLNKPMATMAIHRLQKSYSDLKAAHDKTDKDLVEGYSYLKPKSMKCLIEYFDEAICNLNDRLGVLNASRKPRKCKPKSVQTQIKNLKFMEKSNVFGVDSVKPSDILGTQGFLMFNTKNNKATVFVAAEPKTGLLVKGSTVIGFDSSKSFEKTVRKSEEFVKNTNDCRKTFAVAVRYLNNIKTKSVIPTGRVNKHCLLLQVQ